MIADLLQPHEGGQDNAPSPHSIRSFDLLSQIGDGLLVERCLLAAQGAEGLHLGLVRQVSNDALVRLETPQNIGPHQIAQGAVRVMGPVAQAFDEGRKLLG